MSTIQWVSSEFEIDRSRVDRQANKDRFRFESTMNLPLPSTAPVAAGAPATAESIPSEVSGAAEVKNILEQVAIRVSDSGTELALSWDTAELGSLQLEIRREGDQIEVMILTDSERTAELLEAHQAVLSDLLADEGLQLTRFVAVHGASRRIDIDSERNDSDSEITSLLGVIRRASSS